MRKLLLFTKYLPLYQQKLEWTHLFTLCDEVLNDWAAMVSEQR